MLLSLVIPVFNEEEVLPITLKSLRGVLSSLHGDYEILFVDDGSRDGSLEYLARQAALDRRIKVLSFSRNFGHQAAVTAGLDFAAGEAVIVMDADLQDPPELIPQMLSLFEEGYDIVSPRRISRSGDTWFKRTSAAMFYRVMKKMVDPRLAEEVGDFRLFSARAVAALRRFREQHRFMRGMVAWLGLRETIIPFERQARAAGVTKYPLWKMIRFSWTAITSFSAIPLQMTMGVGVMSCGLAFLYLTYALISAVFFRQVVWGWTSIVFLQCFFFGITLICLGLIGDYVAKIYEEVKGRPLYVVGQAFNTVEPPMTERVVVVEPIRASKTQAR